jgi:hypothetical protein
MIAQFFFVQLVVPLLVPSVFFLIGYLFNLYSKEGS